LQVDGGESNGQILDVKGKQSPKGCNHVKEGRKKPGGNFMTDLLKCINDQKMKRGKKMKRISKTIIAMSLLLTILFCLSPAADAATYVTFKTYTNNQLNTHTFDAELKSNWVGGTYLQTGFLVYLAQCIVGSCMCPVEKYDGIYGPDTMRAIQLFQKAYNLSQDGIVGKNTWVKMYELREGWMYPAYPAQ